MEVLKTQRRSVKGRITRVSTFLENAANANVTKEQAAVRLEGLESAWLDYNRIHSDILRTGDDNDVTQQENDYAEIEEKFYTCKEGLTQLINRVNLQGTGNASNVNQDNQSNQSQTNGEVKLPRIELPKFNGNYLEWSSFHDLFNSIIHKNKNISDSQKLHYLKSSLGGEASGLLQSLEITDANYAQAWQSLIDRYQNERQMIQAHLRSLFNQNALTSESSTGLHRLVDNTMKHVRALNSLGVNTDQWDQILVYTISERLDSDSRRQWELSSPGKKFPKFEELRVFLEQRCRALEASEVKHPVKLQQQNAKWVGRRNPIVNFAISSVKDSTCPLCKEEHPVYRCPEFDKYSSKERTAVTRKHFLCFNCLRKGHSANQCKSESTCRKCGNKHHTLLHIKGPEPQFQAGSSNHQQDTKEVVSNGQPTSVLNHLANNSGSGQVLLSTALVKVVDKFGEQQICRALLDSGSQASFVTESCVQRLGANRSRSCTAISGIANNSLEYAKGKVKLKLASTTSNFQIEVEMLIMNKLTGLIPSRELDISKCNEIPNIQLADPYFYKTAPVDMLLGADIFTELLSQGTISATENMPSAFNTQFGWVLSGKVKQSSDNTTRVHLVQLDISDQLKQFWEIEEVAARREHTIEEKQCEAHFNQTHSRYPDGRYCVALPVKPDHQVLGQSREGAIKRLISCERKLDKEPILRLKYQQVLQEYLDLNHMEMVPKDECNQEEAVYLPHHGVVKESTTTELRVVFDASARTSSGVSLNETLMVGPKLQDDIWEILMRFRCHQYALTADIEKMYRQIRIIKADTNLQRLVWRRNPEEEIEELRLTTVAFGTASAPFLAVRTLHQLTDDEGKPFPLAAQVILRDFYMDDLLTGTDSVEESIQLQSELDTLLNKGGFSLRKWASNESTILKSIPEDRREIRNILNIDTNDTVKTLGLHWHITEDYFTFMIVIQEVQACWTKRRVLSEIARLYDPFGWVAPVIITAKIFMQKLWTIGILWDEPLPEALETDWLKLRGELELLREIRIKRWVNTDRHSSQQLHGFCDASERAYAAVIYLLCEDKMGNKTTHLLCSKTKVAPIKRISLPRLELCGAVLLSKLFKAVQNALNIPLQSSFAWTDSTVVLAWIKGSPQRWKTFVANRVTTIQEIIAPQFWRHVPGIENPADVASRGAFPQDLIDHPLWWSGPNWLILGVEYWPIGRIFTTEDMRIEERVTNVFNVSIQWEIVGRYSSLTKLKRITAYCLRFVNNARSSREKRTIGYLKTTELNEALLLCVRYVQNLEFSDLIHNIRIGNPTKGQISSLNPFIDDQGTLRVGGRIRHANISYDQKCFRF